MTYQHTNYDAFKAMHEARLQRVRASAVAAGLGDVERTHRSPLRFAARMFAVKDRTSVTIKANHSPETMLWA
ncbi:MAG: RNA dependent RNA polymerase [Acidimicrobiia bacterium]|nr:RNA dependent RNA polymerase [Acidimicrobiia bacterium]